MPLKKPLVSLFLAFVVNLPLLGQAVGSTDYINISELEADQIPALIRHLPEWENVLPHAAYMRDGDSVRAAVGDRSVLSVLNFVGGTEAVTAQYPAGLLLMIEYATPQASIEADAAFTEKLSSLGETNTLYRRIGNYNVFVFDATNRTDAEALLDQVKYEKVVQWLGKNPYIISAERAFVLTTSDIFLSTFLVIVMSLGMAIFVGIISGYIFFSIREYKRSSMPTFSDAGGMTRLNLDGFTPDITSERLLKD